MQLPRSALAALTLLLYACSMLFIPRAQPALAQPRVILTTPELIEADRKSQTVDQDSANLYLAYALSNDPRLPARYQSSAPWRGTLPLLQLQEAVPQMRDGNARRTIESLFRGTCDDVSDNLPNEFNSTHFHIEYDTIGGGLTINQYAAALEATWEAEVTDFGWAAPPVLSSSPPPGNRYHVRIDNLGGGLYGFVSSQGQHAGFVGDNPNTTWNDSDAFASCMSVNRDFSGFPGTSQQALEATVAHEFAHSIQFGYGALSGPNEPEAAFVEGIATWMEDEVFDSADDNYNYLWPDFSRSMGEYTPSPYPYWITFRGLTERFGVGTPGGGEQIMQDFFEETSKNTGDNLQALATALGNKGLTLANAYHDYAIAVRFLKTCGGNYVYPYCFEEASNYSSAVALPPVDGTIATIGGTFNSTVEDDYALRSVELPITANRYDVVLQNTSAGGQLRGSVVCDTGTQLVVSALPSVVGTGASATLSGFNPSGCSKVVAVLTNQAQTANNPTSSTARAFTLRTQTFVAPVSPNAAWSSSAQTVAESAGSVNIAAELSATTTVQVTLPYTVTGSATATDHTLVAGTITIAPGAISGTVSFAITNDTLDEQDETIVVTMGTPTNANAVSPTVQTITITDDDLPPTVQASNATIAETAPSAQVVVTLSAPAAVPVTVSYATGGGSATAGSDYVAASGTLTFAPGVTTQTITLQLIDDLLVEPDETFIITLSNPVNATLATNNTITLTITSNDQAQAFTALLPLVVK